MASAKPVNLTPLIAVALTVMPQVNQALNEGGNITVEDAIDIAATAAKAAARQAGVHDRVVAFTKPD